MRRDSVSIVEVQGEWLTIWFFHSPPGHDHVWRVHAAEARPHVSYHSQRLIYDVHFKPRRLAGMPPPVAGGPDFTDADFMIPPGYLRERLVRDAPEDVKARATELRARLTSIGLL